MVFAMSGKFHVLNSVCSMATVTARGSQINRNNTFGFEPIENYTIFDSWFIDILYFDLRNF